jgi:hypothetical protein
MDFKWKPADVFNQVARCERKHTMMLGQAKKRSPIE